MTNTTFYVILIVLLACLVGPGIFLAIRDAIRIRKVERRERELQKQSHYINFNGVHNDKFTKRGGRHRA